MCCSCNSPIGLSEMHNSQQESQRKVNMRPNWQQGRVCRDEISMYSPSTNHKLNSLQSMIKKLFAHCSELLDPARHLLDSADHNRSIDDVRRFFATDDGTEV